MLIVHLQFRTHMNGFPILHCIACILAERSRSASQALGYSLVMDAAAPWSQLLEPSRRCAPATAPAPAPSP
eukprot:4017843-Pleurochrysis_carterae.AAC.1